MSSQDDGDPAPPYDDPEIISLLSDDEVKVEENDDVAPTRTNENTTPEAAMDENVEEIERVLVPQRQLQLLNIGPYDVTTVGRAGALRNKFLEVLVDGDTQIVRLTFWGNQALLELCTTTEQMAVWTFPVHEFRIKKDAGILNHLRTGSIRKVEALLIASRGIMPFNRPTCMKHGGRTFERPGYIPGYWGSWCAGCQWEGEEPCSYEAIDVSKSHRYVPESHGLIWKLE